MADPFLEKLKSAARERAVSEAYDIDTSNCPDIELDEIWTIRPLPGKFRDAVLSLVQQVQYSRAVATSLVYRAYRPQGGRRFRPADVEGLIEDERFIDWIAQEIKFQEDVDSFVDPVGDGKKPSSETSGSTES